MEDSSQVLLKKLCKNQDSEKLYRDQVCVDLDSDLHPERKCLQESDDAKILTADRMTCSVRPGGFKEGQRRVFSINIFLICFYLQFLHFDEL